MLNQAKVIVTI